MNPLIDLIYWLKKNKLYKEAQHINTLINDEPAEYDEPWHEEVVQELNKQKEPNITEINPKQILEDLPKTLTKENIYVESDAEFILKVAQHEGFKILSYLDKGFYGLVFRGIYAGKPAVMKIVPEKRNDNEIRNWNLILQNKNKMTPEQQKHIPLIYKAKEGQLNGIDYKIAIMEELKPLPSGFSRMFAGGNMELSEKIIKEQAIKDPEFLFEVAKEIVKMINQSSTLFSEIANKYSPNYILKILLNSIQPNFQKISINEIIQILSQNVYQQIIKENSIEDEDFLSYYIHETIKNIFQPNGPNKFLIDFDNSPNSVFWKYIPETRELYKMLFQLQKDLNLIAGDVKKDNIMLGNDGNLKIIDVGLYELPGDVDG